MVAAVGVVAAMVAVLAKAPRVRLSLPVPRSTLALPGKATSVSVSLPVTWPSRAAVSGSVVAIGDDSTADAISPSDTDADSRVNDDTAARAQDTVTGTMGVADSVNTTPLDDAPSSTAPPAAATRSATSVRNANTCTWAVDTYALLLPPAPCEDSTTS